MSETILYRACLAIVLLGTSLLVLSASADFVRSRQAAELPHYKQSSPAVPGWPIHQELPIG